jgi:hypothetical protein
MKEKEWFGLSDSLFRNKITNNAAMRQNKGGFYENFAQKKP